MSDQNLKTINSCNVWRKSGKSEDLEFQKMKKQKSEKRFKFNDICMVLFYFDTIFIVHSFFVVAALNIGLSILFTAIVRTFRSHKVRYQKIIIQKRKEKEEKDNKKNKTELRAQFLGAKRRP